MGKSLCYALLPAIFDMKRGLAESPSSIVMVVSPLIALMKDQCTSFAQKGITAGHVSDKEATDRETRRRIQRGECQLVFISPEALFLTMEWRRMLTTDRYLKHLVGFVVDEAHCVKKWYVCIINFIKFVTSINLAFYYYVFTGVKAFDVNFQDLVRSEVLYPSMSMSWR